ncbi:MAG: element excision factor XisH family protein [Nostoc sp. CreGUA01]|nr:element excision factor XisH family protein [Nostoc sp. CreGUA01]
MCNDCGELWKIDLGAERLLAAERGGEKIAVEVKSFLASASAISEFHTPLGQFINYWAALRREEPDRVLYLAVPDLIYNSFFQLDFPASMLKENSDCFPNTSAMNLKRSFQLGILNPGTITVGAI